MKTRLALLFWPFALGACGPPPDASAPDALSHETETSDVAHEGSLVWTGLRHSDADWLAYAACYDVSEVKLATLARSRGRSEAVQGYGVAQMERHQGSFNAAVIWAQHAGVTLTPRPSQTGEQQFQQLGHIGVAIFDREFLALQVSLQREAAQVMAEAERAVVSESLRLWLQRSRARWLRDASWANQLFEQVLTGHATQADTFAASKLPADGRGP